MSPGRVAKGSARGIGVLVRAALVSAVLSAAVMPATAPVSYVEESPSPSPSPTAQPTRTASPSPSPEPTAAEPLPPADDEYWDEMDDPNYEPPSPTPTASARASQAPQRRTDRVGPSGPSGGNMEIDADSRDGEPAPAGEQPAPADGPGRSTGLYSQDAYPPGTFDGGYGLFTPEISGEAPLTATPDGGAGPVVPPSGSRSTEPVIRRLAEAKASLEQVARTLAPFPVAGLATYTASWKPPAAAPGIAEGQGAAIAAREGTPVVAAANGPITRVAPDPAWGTTLELTGPDGTKYRYGRLLRVAPAIQDGMQVTRGQIIGFVGGTGTVAGGSYLWFQLADKAGTVVAPFEYLDRWLKEALITARVTTGLPALDKADEVAAGLLSPEEAGMRIGPDGRPVSAEGDMSALEAFLSICFFALLGWRGWLSLRKRLAPRWRRTAPEPQRMDLGFPVPPSGSAALGDTPAEAEHAETSA